jgi:hypothetical protein
VHIQQEANEYVKLYYTELSLAIQSIFCGGEFIFSVNDDDDEGDGDCDESSA